jgi:hypothetical protein
VSTRTKILAAVGALAALVLLLSRGGGESSAQLQALEDDAMASYVPPGGTLVDTDSKNEGTSLGKPVQAQLTRLFQVRAGQGQVALADAREAATADGWTPVGPATQRAFVAEKELSEGRAGLTVTLVEDERLLPEGVKPPALSVSLRDLGS